MMISLGDFLQWFILIAALAALLKAWGAERKSSEGVDKITTVSDRIDGMLTERDKAKVREGEEIALRAGAEAAEQLARGRREGREDAERSFQKVAIPVIAATGLGGVNNGDETPVKDRRVASATERIAEASERTSAAGERVAAAAEEEKKK